MKMKISNSAALAVGTAAALLAGIGMTIVAIRRLSRSAPPGSRPVRFDFEVEIARPAEEVFAFVATFENDPLWTPDIEEVRKTSEGPLGVGTTFEAGVRVLGRRFETSFEITQYDEVNRRVGLRTSSGPVHSAAVRSVEAVPGGARFTVTAETRTGGFFWLLPDALFAVLLRRRSKPSLDRLKSILEGRS